MTFPQSTRVSLFPVGFTRLPFSDPTLGVPYYIINVTLLFLVLLFCIAWTGWLSLLFVSPLVSCHSLIRWPGLVESSIQSGGDKKKDGWLVGQLGSAADLTSPFLSSFTVHLHSSRHPTFISPPDPCKTTLGLVRSNQTSMLICTARARNKGSFLPLNLGSSGIRTGISDYEQTRAGLFMTLIHHYPLLYY